MKNPASIRLTAALVYGALACWFLFALGMGLGGHYQTDQSHPPLVFGLSVFVPIVVLIMLYRLSNSLRSFAHSVDLRLLVGLHAWRILGIDFLVRYAQGQLPGGFAFPAGIGDIITGATAVPLALAIFGGGGNGARKRFVTWNLFGLADLMVALASGILHSQSAFGILVGAGPTTALMSQYPRSLIPTFLVPFYILLHLLALTRRGEVPERPSGIRSNGMPAHA